MCSESVMTDISPENRLVADTVNCFAGQEISPNSPNNDFAAKLKAYKAVVFGNISRNIKASDNAPSPVQSNTAVPISATYREMLRIGTSEVNICQKNTDTQQKPAIPLSYPFSYGGGYGANLFCACYFQHFGTLRKRGTGGLNVVCKKYCFAVKI